MVLIPIHHPRPPMLRQFSRVRHRQEEMIIAFFAFANVIFHFLLPEYGYHRDEMYYVAIADGFSFSNLDMPPVAPLYLKLFLALFGHSVKTLHLAASVCGGLVIVFGCLIAKEFGGKRYAVFLTGTFLLFSGLLIFGSLYTYDNVSFVLWAAVLYLMVKMLKGADQRLWLVAGLLLGLGMLTKLSILFLGLALFVSLWLVRERRWYRQPWIWLGAAIALLCSLPYVYWQSIHGWYFLSYARSYAGMTTHASPLIEFLWHQLMPNNLALSPIWLAGLMMLLVTKRWSDFRFFGYCYIILCISLFWSGGQFYFMIPMYSVLVAAGAVAIEEWFGKRSNGDRPHVRAKIAVPVVYILFSLPALPFFVPLLPVDLLVQYVSPLGVTAGVKTQDRHITDLPQHMADRFGWEEMARAVALVYHQAQKNSAEPVGIATGNWGEASAVHVYRTAFGLVEPISGDGWYYFETLQRHTFCRSYVAIGIPRSELQSVFQHVEQKGVFTHPHCMPDENNNPIYLCTDPTLDLRKYWAVLKRMDPEFEDVLNREGVDQAVEYFHLKRGRDPGVMLFAERHMNALGYQYLNRGRVADAIALFLMNVEAYPGSFNVYDSYAEALMADRQYVLAMQNYARSVELNPENKNGRNKLEELKLWSEPP